MHTVKSMLGHKKPTGMNKPAGSNQNFETFELLAATHKQANIFQTKECLCLRRVLILYMQPSPPPS